LYIVRHVVTAYTLLDSTLLPPRDMYKRLKLRSNLYHSLPFRAVTRPTQDDLCGTRRQYMWYMYTDQWCNSQSYFGIILIAIRRHPNTGRPSPAVPIVCVLLIIISFYFKFKIICHIYIIIQVKIYSNIMTSEL